MIRILLMFLLFATFTIDSEGKDTLAVKPPIISVNDVDQVKKDLDFLEKKKKIRLKPRKNNNIEMPRYNIENVRYILIFLIGVLILALIINYAINKDKVSENQKTDPLDIEEISEVNLENLLNNALENNDYKLALRIRFLIILQSLESKKYIKWHKHKTNRKYINEIPEILRSDFKNVAYTFDKVWYGNNKIDSDLYHNLSHYFQSFQLKL